MLRVLQLIPTLDRSGAEKQMVVLARGLPRERFEVEVAALTRLGPLEADLRAAGLPVTLIGKRLKADPMALARLAAFMKARRFDVLQTWIFAADVYGRLAARRAKVPVVVTNEMAVDLWKGRVQRAIDRRLARRTDRVVGNSNAVVDFYRRLGIPDEKLACIPSGIEDLIPPAADPAEVRRSLGLAPDAQVAIFVGRLAPQKAVDDLVTALDLLQHVRPALRTWIVGDGPLRTRLEETARAFRLDLDGRVRFLGQRDDVPALLAAADLLVLPSLYEGLPNVVLEAMQFGKPVVATSAPGTTEVVADGLTGLLVPVHRPQDLARAIRAVIDDPAFARRLGDAGRARIAAEFRAATMVGRFAELYETLARSKGVLQ
ncbi:MAG TPA: glycosyltransferase [Isosphaeraceae bacterium]|jgi:glycosyltransferase involved in cell wall biosynthesis|nr:glycosyltransferase [Isosphaeraceae bacterium]